MKKVIIDIFGADAGPAPIIRGALRALEQHPELGLIFIGNRAEIEAHCTESSRIEIIETDDFIGNNENPAVIFTGRDNSSIALGFARLKSDEDCIGMLSAGSTGALLVGSICRLGLMEGLKTPALSSNLPLWNGETFCLVDCGANIQCTAKDLVRFARMGDAFRRSIKPETTPRVALLSVGREDSKGTPLLQETFQLLKEEPLNFIGNMEGNDMVMGYADVVVADGFAGNLMLKSTEAAGLLARGIVEKLAGQAGKENDALIQAIRQKLTLTFDFNTRGGATFLGTQKTVIKMHGCAVEETPVACIDQLLRLEAAGFSAKIKEALK